MKTILRIILIFITLFYFSNSISAETKEDKEKVIILKTQKDLHAYWLGSMILEIKESLKNPDREGALDPIIKLGRHTHYSGLVRVWLREDMKSLMNAKSNILSKDQNADVSAYDSKILFYKRAIRAIDLE